MTEIKGKKQGAEMQCDKRGQSRWGSLSETGAPETILNGEKEPDMGR